MTTGHCRPLYFYEISKQYELSNHFNDFLFFSDFKLTTGQSNSRITELAKILYPPG